MKQLIALFIFSFCLASIHAQQAPANSTTQTGYVHAQFSKGEKGWRKFVMNKLDDFTTEHGYPSGDRSVTAIIGFKIDTSGNVIDIELLQSSKIAKTDKYAKSIIQASPKWIPATYNGQKTVSQVIKQMITFESREF